MKKYIVIPIALTMTLIVLLSTSGFTLIHHHCTDCGLREMHFSIFEKDPDYICDHLHQHQQEQTCSACCVTSCNTGSHTQENTTTCCSNELEFYKLLIPISTVQDDETEFSPDSTQLFNYETDLFIGFYSNYYSGVIYTDSGPPLKYLNQSINKLHCVFLC